MQAQTTYYVRAWVCWHLSDGVSQITYGPQLVFTTASAVSEGVLTGGHPAVDMGTGLLWSVCNIGAQRPEETGDFYAWGEVMPKQTFTMENYYWYSNDLFTKYNTADGIKRLQPSDDAAVCQWQQGWRMPTVAEFEALISNSVCTPISVNGVQGVRLTSKSTGQTLFMPAAGCSFDSSNPQTVYFWTSELSSMYEAVSYVLPRDYVNSQCASLSFTRESGLSVRAVHELP
ncbi:MAG: hypothetical protein J6Y77_05320 [Paludibacteraceae bacterium]|nr:hypothetical protein [Paludibacteraceae bacterium]